MKARSSQFITICFLIAMAGSSIARTQETQDQTAGLDGQNPFHSFQSFSATMHGGIREDKDRKIYRSGNLMRLDFDGSYRVVDLEQHLTWGVASGQCAEIAAPDAGSFPFSAEFKKLRITRAPSTEKETIDGHACKVETLTLTPTDGRPTVAKMKLWEAEDLEGFPVKIETEVSGQRTSISYTDVSLKAPDGELFVHPAKCTLAPQSGQKGTMAVGPPPAKVTPEKKP